MKMLQRGLGLGHVLALALAIATMSAQAQPRTDRLTVPLSDPSRPSTVKIRLIQGGVTIKGSTGRDVVVESSGARVERGDRPPTPRADGLRRLTPPTGLNVEEDDNAVSITARPSDYAQVDVQVPTRTNLQVSVVNGGAIVVENVDGDLEVNNVNGSITLTNVGGSVVAHAVNGRLVATLRQVTPQKPMAFTSLNGEVDVTLPESLQANLKLRSDRGDVFTDFDVRTTAPPSVPAVPAVPGASSSSRPDRSSDRGRARDRDRNRANSGGFRLETDAAVYGTVNGGGPEVELRTFNGDIYLRKGRN